MKKTILSVLNAILCVSLTSVNTILACKYGLNNEGLNLICFAAFFFLIYALGMIAPIGTARFLYKFGVRLCKKSDTAKIVTEAEAIRAFKKGRSYFLLTTNILLILWLFSFLC